ncbi:glycosyltransferase family 4 protein [Geothermobacter hydrogeniphilus]|nr:glycosyltransferase family 4 protein [Geothermobacter hydrogeniphilus]
MLRKKLSLLSQGILADSSFGLRVRMMKVWYLHHYAAPPDCGAPMRAHYLAKSLAPFGHDVTVVAASCHHLRKESAPEKDHLTLRSFDEVQYFQLPTRSYVGNAWTRLSNMFDYNRQVKLLPQVIAAGRLAKPDVLIASSPHLFAFPAVNKIAEQLSAKVVFEVRDLWPLSLVELLGVPAWHPLVVWMGMIEKQGYKKADAVVSLLENAYQYMGKRGLDRDKFHYISNGADLDESVDGVELPHDCQSLFERLKKREKLIVVYAGAHGPPNALDQVLDLKKLVGSKEAPYHFVFIGDGSSKQQLEDRVRNEKISFISFFPRMSKKQVSIAVKKSDVCFIGWNNKNIYSYGTSPNKIGDYFVASKPVINAIGHENDIVNKICAGIVVPPYNPDRLDAALRKMYALTDEERKTIGRRGRVYVEKSLRWEILGEKYSKLLTELNA